MDVLGFDHIHLKAKDVDSTSKWYCNVFGGEITFQGKFMGSKVYYVNIKGTNFIIFGKLKGEENIASSTLETRYGIDHFGFQVEDINQTIEGLRGKNVNIIQKPECARSGLYTAYIKGPDNIRIELIQRD